MKKLQNRQSGFGAIELLLVLTIVAIVAFIGIYMVRSHTSTKKAASAATSNNSTTTTPAMHTTQEATTFVQTTYNSYLAAIKNAGVNNTQPLGLVGLAAVKGTLTSGFYTQAAVSHNGSSFSCAAEFTPTKYTASPKSSTATTATVSVSIGIDNQGGTSASGPLIASVDLVSLKITSVTCPS